jgi:hypothetical protein
VAGPPFGSKLQASACAAIKAAARNVVRLADATAPVMAEDIPRMRRLRLPTLNVVGRESCKFLLAGWRPRFGVVVAGPSDIIAGRMTRGDRSRRLASALAGAMAVAGWIALGAFAGVARADPAEDAAEELIRKGVELRRQRKDLEAYDYFRRAHELRPTPRPTAQLGLVEYQLGRWVDAERHLDEAVRSTDHPWIQQNRATIDEALATVRTHIAFIELRGSPAGAEVEVNGRKVGKLPLADLVKAGEGYAEVLVTAPGHTPVRRTLNLQAALTQQLFVTLESIGAGSPPGPTAGPPPAGGLREEAARPRRGVRAAGLALGAGGLAALGYGVYQTFQVKRLSEQVRPGDTRGEARGRSAEQRQWLGYAVGAAMIAGGGVLSWFGWARPSQVARRPGVTVAIWPGADGFLVALQLAR